MEYPMSRTRLLPLIAFWLCIAGAAGAQTLGVSVHPGKGTGNRPDSEKVGSLFMAMCLNHFMDGKLDWAEQACSQAIEADPSAADAYKVRGYVRLMGHRFERASGDFRAALQLKPTDDQNVAGYGESLSGLGHFSDAVVQFRKALRLAPQRAAYWNGLCWALAGEGRQLPTALNACNRALSLAPGAAGILNSRAMVYLHLRRYPLAVADYAASLEVQSDQASAWFGRGLARLFLREKQGLLDIAEARRRDAGVDALFVQMGVLPSHCLKAAGLDCPRGFPLLPEVRPGAYQVARLHADADQQLFLAFKADPDDMAAGKTSR
jgi:tetratricopeptide (TPR) repeat protein